MTTSSVGVMLSSTKCGSAGASATPVARVVMTTGGDSSPTSDETAPVGPHPRRLMVHIAMQQNDESGSPSPGAGTSPWGFRCRFPACMQLHTPNDSRPKRTTFTPVAGAEATANTQTGRSR